MTDTPAEGAAEPIVDDPAPIEVAEPAKKYTLPDMRWHVVEMLDRCRTRSGKLSPEAWLRVTAEDYTALEAMLRFFEAVHPVQKELGALLLAQQTGRGKNGRTNTSTKRKAKSDGS